VTAAVRDAAGPDAGRTDRWVVALARSLRAEGLRCSLHESLAARDALEHLDLSDALDGYFGLRSVFVSDPSEIPAFDRCFWAAWGTPQGSRPGHAMSRPPAPGQARRPPRVGDRDPAAPSVLERLSGRAAPPGGPRGEAPVRGAYSPSEGLTRRSFAGLEEREVRALERVLDRLALRLATRRSRRTAPTGRRGVVDLRRSLRVAVRHDGELVRLARRRRRVERPRIVLLCDVSGSMERYSRFLLRFILALGRSEDVEAFAFSTRLTRLRPGRSRRLDQALEALRSQMRDWPGGTRIGASLETFLELYGRRLLGTRTVVVILSDGLDRGDTAALERAMRGIQRRARKVIWLNPLLESPAYEPEARGMKAALPFVDEFAPGHSLEALRDLARMIRL
jgi:uncharacterized protein with von Willebrand factor type A (vWA) domain